MITRQSVDALPTFKEIIDKICKKNISNEARKIAKSGLSEKLTRKQVNLINTCNNQTSNKNSSSELLRAKDFEQNQFKLAKEALENFRRLRIAERNRILKYLSAEIGIKLIYPYWTESKEEERNDENFQNRLQWSFRLLATLAQIEGIFHKTGHALTSMLFWRFLANYIGGEKSGIVKPQTFWIKYLTTDVRTHAERRYNPERFKGILGPRGVYYLWEEIRPLQYLSSSKTQGEGLADFLRNATQEILNWYFTFQDKPILRRFSVHQYYEIAEKAGIGDDPRLYTSSSGEIRLRLSKKPIVRVVRLIQQEDNSTTYEYHDFEMEKGSSIDFSQILKPENSNFSWINSEDGKKDRDTEKEPPLITIIIPGYMVDLERLDMEWWPLFCDSGKGPVFSLVCNRSYVGYVGTCCTRVGLYAAHLPVDGLRTQKMARTIVQNYAPSSPVERESPQDKNGQINVTVSFRSFFSGETEKARASALVANNEEIRICSLLGMTEIFTEVRLPTEIQELILETGRLVNWWINRKFLEALKRKISPFKTISDLENKPEARDSGGQMPFDSDKLNLEMLLQGLMLGFSTSSALTAAIAARTLTHRNFSYCVAAEGAARLAVAATGLCGAEAYQKLTDALVNPDWASIASSEIRNRSNGIGKGKKKSNVSDSREQDVFESEEENLRFAWDIVRNKLELIANLLPMKLSELRDYAKDLYYASCDRQASKAGSGAIPILATLAGYYRKILELAGRIIDPRATAITAGCIGQVSSLGPFAKVNVPQEDRSQKTVLQVGERFATACTGVYEIGISNIGDLIMMRRIVTSSFFLEVIASLCRDYSKKDYFTQIIKDVYDPNQDYSEEQISAIACQLVARIQESDKKEEVIRILKEAALAFAKDKMREYVKRWVAISVFPLFIEDFLPVVAEYCREQGLTRKPDQRNLWEVFNPCRLLEYIGELPLAQAYHFN